MPTVNGIISSVDGDLTYMGKIMAYLPLEPPMSKLIYFGYIFNILNEAIIMGMFINLQRSILCCNIIFTVIVH